MNFLGQGHSEGTLSVAFDVLIINYHKKKKQKKRIYIYIYIYIYIFFEELIYIVKRQPFVI